jgi:hypothetical protein
MKRTAMLAAVMILLAGCGSTASPGEERAPAASPSVFTLSVLGQITVGDGLTVDGPGSLCLTTGTGYDDIAAGTAVVVKDNTGAQVAIGRLGEGVTSPDSTNYSVKCIFSFTVRDVPGDSPIYSLSVGSRGETSYSRADLNSPISLTLG